MYFFSLCQLFGKTFFNSTPNFSMAAFNEIISVVVVALSISSILLYNFQWWHVVHEGNVGFYYQFGKMMDSMTDPGLHFKFPSPITSAIQIYVRPQVDSVTCPFPHHIAHINNTRYQQYGNKNR